MSQRYPSSKNPEPQERITHIVDHTNIDDFFNQPSPHELTATSERRVQETIEDLKRRTAEEIKNWSWNSFDEEDIEAAILRHTTESAKVISDRDMVSSLVSLPPASLSWPSSESNCPAAFPVEPKIQSCAKSNRSTRVKASSSSPQDKLLRMSDGNHEPHEPAVKVPSYGDLGKTPFRPLGVRRGANVPPPIPIIAGDFAYQCPRTPLEDPRIPPPPRQVTPATPSRALQQIAEVEQILNLIGHSKAEQRSVSHKQTPITSVQDSVVSGVDRSSTPFHAAPVAPLGIRRKPLPADSPLLVPIKEHSVFTNVTPGRNETWK